MPVCTCIPVCAPLAPSRRHTRKLACADVTQQPPHGSGGGARATNGVKPPIMDMTAPPFAVYIACAARVHSDIHMTTYGNAYRHARVHLEKHKPTYRNAYRHARAPAEPPAVSRDRCPTAASGRHWEPHRSSCASEKSTVGPRTRQAPPPPSSSRPRARLSKSKKNALCAMNQSWFDTCAVHSDMCMTKYRNACRHARDTP